MKYGYYINDGEHERAKREKHQHYVVDEERERSCNNHTVKCGGTHEVGVAWRRREAKNAST